MKETGKLGGQRGSKFAGKNLGLGYGPFSLKRLEKGRISNTGNSRCVPPKIKKRERKRQEHGKSSTCFGKFPKVNVVEGGGECTDTKTLQKTRVGPRRGTKENGCLKINGLPTKKVNRQRSYMKEKGGHKKKGDRWTQGGKIPRMGVMIFS